MKTVTTSGTVEYKLRVIDAREVERACRLHLAHGETERPRVCGKIIDDTIGEICAVHFGNNIVVVHVRGVLKEWSTVNVERGSAEVVLIGPVATGGLTGNHVDRFHGVVEIA
tara:strand:- start:2477 stop:2812 length:336 start_codon:yes stop_codon:yes gene_type:complete